MLVDIIRTILAISSLHVIINGQLQIGDISPDFSAPICMNGEDSNPQYVNGDTWSLYDEGQGKVTWINLYTSW